MVKGIYKEIGFLGLWKGLNQRMLMVGSLTACQWFIYDQVKRWFGMGASGGINKGEGTESQGEGSLFSESLKEE